MTDLSILDYSPLAIAFGLAWLILPSLAERMGKIAEQVTAARVAVSQGPYTIAQTAMEAVNKERDRHDANEAAMRQSIEELREEVRKGFKSLRDDIRELTRKDTP